MKNVKISVMSKEGEMEKEFEIIEDKDYVVFDDDNVCYKVWRTRKTDFVLWSMMGPFRYVFDEKGSQIAEFAPAGMPAGFFLISIPLMSLWVKRADSYKLKNSRMHKE